MFFNISNHPSSLWGPEQRAAAARYGEIRDLRFPAIAPDCPSAQIDALADQYAGEVLKAGAAAAMVQGEFVFTYRLVSRLKAAGVPALAAATERCTEEYANEDGTTEKKSRFSFAGFRPY